MAKAQVALEVDADAPRTSPARGRGLGLHDFLLTRRVALEADLPSTLVHRSTRRRGLPDLVDPSSLALLERLQAVAKQLAHGGTAELVQRVRDSGHRRRARLLESGNGSEGVPKV